MDSCSSICICKPCNIIIRYRNLIVLDTALTIHVAIVSGASFVTPAAYMDVVTPAAYMDVVTPAAFRVAPSTTRVWSSTLRWRDDAEGRGEQLDISAGDDGGNHVTKLKQGIPRCCKLFCAYEFNNICILLR